MRKTKLLLAACAMLGVMTANADVMLETDMTSSFNSLATTQWTGSSGQVGWAAQKVTTNSGLEVAAWERYFNDCTYTGEIMSTNVTGLVAGTYKIELYGAAAFTFGRGFGSTAFTEGSEDHNDSYKENDKIDAPGTGVVLFASTSEDDYELEIPIWYATNFNTSGLSTVVLEGVVVGADGNIKIGMSKTTTSTNWHVVQLKGVTATVSGDAAIAALKATATSLLEDANYVNMTGTERTNLEAAKAATPAEETKEAYQEVIANLNSAISAFENAKIAYDAAIAAYNDALAAAKAIADGTIPATAYTNLQSEITDNTVTDGTTAQYNDATTALKTAATAASALVDPYAEYLDTKAAVITMKEADTYTGADAKTTLEGVISTTTSNVEAATGASAIESEIAALVAAAKTFVKNVKVNADACIDITCLIKNQHFTKGKGGTNIPDGWTLESGEITEHRLLTHNFETYHKKFNLSQTITSLPKGTYKVTLQGFARHDGSETDKTNLYCGIVNQPIKAITDEYSTTPIADGKPAMGDNNGEKNTDGKYRPNGMSGSYYFFQEVNPATSQPFYTNEVQTLITEDGDLKIGFKCETNTDWVIWDNFHLYYYGSAIAVTIDEDAASSSYAEDIENANITLKRTFNTTNWNTIALPFELSDAETKAAFGNDVKVATFSETLVGADSEVEFNIAADAAITANTPVLLKTTTAETSFTFNGKTIKAGEAKAEGKNFDFVGTYAASTTIADGDYFISSDKLWKSAGATTIKGTRAYLKAKSATARIASFVIGDEATGISEMKVAANDKAIFNLQGQRVKNAQKGLFIQNGKKVIIK
jgi:hypothetical protein